MTTSSMVRIGISEAMLGGHADRPVSQGEVLAELFRSDGHEVRTTSTVKHRIPRLIDTARSIVGWRGHVDVAVVAVFSGQGFVPADVSSLLAARLGIPSVLFLHGGNLPVFARRHPAWFRRVLGRAARVVAPSGYLADVGREAGFEVSVIPNVVRSGPVEFRLRREVGPKLLWMRSLHPLYAPEVAIETLARLHRVRADAVLTMAGPDKGLLDDCTKLAADLGVSHAVSFPGFIDQAQKADAFARHDLFLNTSRTDNAPVALLEAAAAGLPIITSDVGGISQLMGDAAVMVPPDDVDAMSDAVMGLLADPERARRLSEAGTAIAEASTWPQVRVLWSEVFDEVCRGG